MKKTFLILLFSLSIFSATARILSIRATLNGANVVPATASTATGTLAGTYDDVSKIMSFTLTFSGLSGSVSGAYIGEGAINSSGLLLHTLPVTTSPYTTTIGPLSNAHSTAVLTGNSFIQIESSGYNNPEIRGQIIIGTEIFNNAARNDFYSIGGYSFTEGYIPNGIQASPYVRSGPSPQNDFMYVATTPDGSALYGSFGELSTFNTNRPITLTFKGNNVRKLGLNVFEVDQSDAYSSGTIVATITTNLNNTATLTSTSGQRFVGFRVINENEYIVSATFSANPGFFTSLKDLMIGDDKPQNVALNFDGVDDYVSIPSNNGNNTGNYVSFVVTCWIKPDATQPSSAINPDENDIISKWAGLDAGANNNYPFVVRYLNTTRSNVSERGKILVGIWDGTNFPTVISTTPVNDGKWHHVAFVKTNTTNTLTLYIDGILNGSTTNTITNTTINTTPLQIGRRGNGQNYFRGEIDEVRIWSTNKDQATIQAEMFCKNPNTTALQAAYNFSNGVPHDNNSLVTQVQDASTRLGYGTLNNFAKTGDASNFVTGQVKYVSGAFTGGDNGSSWANGFDNLKSALTSNTCNDLFEVYVAKGFSDYKPTITSNTNESFTIPAGMRVYGGFAGTEKSINQRNLALIHTTNATILSGDLGSNDIPFDFATNRSDNSEIVVNIVSDNAIFDGFTVRGAKSTLGGGINVNASYSIIKNCKLTDNLYSGIYIDRDYPNISNCTMAGNGNHGIFVYDITALNINNCLIVNNGNSGIYTTYNAPRPFTISNCTIAANQIGVSINYESTGNLQNNFTNTIIYGNSNVGISNSNLNGGIITNNITYSLVQGITSGTGNLNGNTTNPQFVSPLASGFGSLTANPNNFGNYRLKWCSLAIGAGTNTGISPLDLDRNPRNFNGTADMGAFEFLGNTPSPTNATSNITGTIDSSTYAGGAIQTITSTAKILAPAGAIDFKAPNSIILSPGFEARGVGKYFQALIGANVTCSN